jgi:hypothetical protein
VLLVIPARAEGVGAAALHEAGAAERLKEGREPPIRAHRVRVRLRVRLRLRVRVRAGVGVGVRVVRVRVRVGVWAWAWA